MGQQEDDFPQQLLATFKIEAEESLQALSAGVLALEKEPTPEEQLAIIEAIYRDAHNLKGAARTVNLTTIEMVCQSLESVFAALKRQKLRPSPPVCDTLHHTLDTVRTLLATPKAGEMPPLAALLEQLASLEACEQERDTSAEDDARRLAKGIFPRPQADHGSEADTPGKREGGLLVSPQPGDNTHRQSVPGIRTLPALADTVRISTAKLEALFTHAESMLAAKLIASQRTADLREVQAMLALWKQAWAKVSPEVRRVQQALQRPDAPPQHGPIAAQLTKPLEFLEWHHTHLAALESKVHALTGAAADGDRELGGMVDELLKEMKQLLLLPFATLLDMLPKLVRDLSRDQGKIVELVLEGSEIEIDRRILEGMKDPLIHFVRNCIDHGLETPEERTRTHKSPCGTVRVAISQVHGNKVEMLIADDGRGINLAHVKAAAMKCGRVAAKDVDTLSQQEALALIFQADVSTSPIVTNISGRGLGLAIVREKVEKLGGAITVSTEPSKGTAFRILLPVTLATFRGVLVQVAGQIFVIPTVHVDRVLRITREAITTVENREAIPLHGRMIPLVRLAAVLELPQTDTEEKAGEVLPVVILGTADTRIAFRVEAVLHEQEVLVKSLGKQLSRVRHIAGATVLGAGTVAPILNVADLLKSAVRAAGTRGGAAVTTGEATGPQQSILVVEDSITSRMLLKSILEAAGYQVHTAIDGADALAVLKTVHVDLVVSDIEMPRMNGFELTRKMRSDEQLAHLPVVLVTSLTSREDRERGIEAGANAYFVKSSFDQDNLLEVLRKLM